MKLESGNGQEWEELMDKAEKPGVNRADTGGESTRIDCEFMVTRLQDGSPPCSDPGPLFLPPFCSLPQT